MERFGTPYFLYYRTEIAASITLLGQTYIKKSAKAAIKYICNTISRPYNTPEEKAEVEQEFWAAGDTDSVTGDTNVYFNGTQIPISDVYEKLSENGDLVKSSKNHFVLKPNIPCTTKTVENWEEVETPIKYIMKHKTPKHLYKITLPDGKSVKVTEDHSLMVERDFSMVETTVKDLKPTDKIIHMK